MSETRTDNGRPLMCRPSLMCQPSLMWQPSLMCLSSPMCWSLLMCRPSLITNVLVIADVLAITDVPVITDVAAITNVLVITDVLVIADVPAITDVAAVTDVPVITDTPSSPQPAPDSRGGTSATRDAPSASHRASPMESAPKTTCLAPLQWSACDASQRCQASPMRSASELTRHSSVAAAAVRRLANRRCTFNE